MIEKLRWDGGARRSTIPAHIRVRTLSFASDGSTPEARADPRRVGSVHIRIEVVTEHARLARDAGRDALCGDFFRRLTADVVRHVAHRFAAKGLDGHLDAAVGRDHVAAN